jgi:8-hydroxy-5-deazaflavin:NADPH oxidoreductase
MKTRQTIAVIGAAGNLGSILSRRLASENYRLLLCGEEQEKIDNLVAGIRKTNTSADVESLLCSVNASWEADIIILAMPSPQEKQVALKIREVANQKIVLSITTPLNEIHDEWVSDSPSRAAEELQKLLPNSKVFKAFNTNFTADVKQPVIDALTSDAIIAGNDKEALTTVSELLSALGCNPVFAGRFEKEAASQAD